MSTQQRVTMVAPYSFYPQANPAVKDGKKEKRITREGGDFDVH